LKEDLQLVQESVQRRKSLGKTLSLSSAQHDLVGLCVLLERIGIESLPVIEHALWEGLAGSSSSKVGIETEGLVDWEVSFHHEHGSSGDGFFSEDVSSLSVEDGVDTTHGGFWALDLDEVDGLEESWLGGHDAGVEASSRGGDELSASSMDGISVEGDVVEIESDSSHIFVAEDTFLGGPVETGLDGILDFVEELDSLGDIDDHVGTVLVWAEAPDLSAVVDVPLVLLGHVSSSGLDIVSWSDLLVLDLVSHALWEWGGLHVETVMLVGRLGEAGLVGGLGDGLSVRDDGFGLLDGDAGVVFFKILEADLQVEFSGTSDDMFTGLFRDNLDHRIGLGESLETFDELGEIGGVLALDGTSDNGRDRELHLLHVVGAFEGGDGTGLDEVLIDTDETDQVTAWNIIDGFDVSSHHKDGSLDLLEVQIGLLAGNEVGAHDSDLLASGDLSGEYSAESVESTLIRSGDHLGDVGHEWTVGVTGSESLGEFIVLGTFVQHLASISLGGERRWKVDSNHLEKSLTSWKPVSHEALEKGLASEVLVVSLEGDAANSHDLVGFLHLFVHDGSEGFVDGIEDPLDETSLGSSLGHHFDPLLGLGVVESIAPEVLHHLVQIDVELGGVHLGELLESEGPAVETGTETDGTVTGRDVKAAHWTVLIGATVSSDDDVDVLDDSSEGLVKLFGVELEFEKSSVHLVHEKNGLYTLGNSLSEDGLGLDADAGDAINDDESTIGNSESRCDFRGEIDVAGGIDQVDQESVAVGLLLDEGHVDVAQLVEHGDGGRLDGNASFLFVLSGVSESGLTGLAASDDTSFTDKRVSKGRLAVIDVSNDGHISDVLLLVHDLTDLIYRKIDHRGQLSTRSLKSKDLSLLNN